MNILHPKKNLKQPDFKNLSELPSVKGGGSGYYLLSLVEDGLTLYVCLTNAMHDKVHIEKTTKLNKNKFLCVEDLEIISDDNEFATIYQFLIDKKVLNG